MSSFESFSFKYSPNVFVWACQIEGRTIYMIPVIEAGWIVEIRCLW